jgi:hypothetical protein
MESATVLRPWAIDHAPPPRDMGLGARLALNSRYFDTLLSLIPAKYYLRPDDDDADGEADSKYYKNKKGAQPGAGSIKENTKKAKKLRFTQGAWRGWRGVGLGAAHVRQLPLLQLRRRSPFAPFSSRQPTPALSCRERQEHPAAAGGDGGGSCARR